MMTATPDKIAKRKPVEVSSRRLLPSCSVWPTPTGQGDKTPARTVEGDVLKGRPFEYRDREVKRTAWHRNKGQRRSGLQPVAVGVSMSRPD